MFAAISDISRLVAAAAALARHDALLPREYATRMPAGLRAIGALSRIFARRNERDRRPGERLAVALERLGPAYIKLGQFLATRPDIVGRELAADLSRLQDRLPPFSEDEARAALDAELGEAAKRVSALGPAIAAASIAQVHKASVEGLGEIAVKILRPDVEAACARDLRAFARAARWAQALAPAMRRLEPVRFIETVAHAVRLELDLRMEAAAASELAENFQDDETFRTPNVYWGYSGRRVFSMEWIEGTPISDVEQLRDAGVDLSALARQIMQSFLSQALRDGFFHADIHQGNLMVDAEGRLVALDFGIMGRLDERSQRYLAEIVFGFLNRDYERVARMHIDAGYVPAHYEVAEFAQALRSVGEPVVGLEADKISMGALLGQLFEITDLFDMHMRPELILLQKTMVTTEGVARMLDPDHNMWETARPIVEEWVGERLGPQGQLKSAADSAQQLARMLQALPETLRKAELAAAHISEDGIRLDTESVEALARVQAKRGRLTRNAAWAAIGAAALAAISAFLS